MAIINYHTQVISYDSDQYQEAVALRYKILRKPLGLRFSDEDLACDNDEYILTIAANHQIIGVLQLRNYNEKTYKLRQMAIASAWQRKGVGSQLIQYAITFTKQKGKEKIILHARQIAIPFYAKLGFKIVGTPFKEVGIPHCKMELLL